MNLYYESMTRVKWNGWTARVWRQWESKLEIGSNEDLRDVFKVAGPISTVPEIRRKLFELERVNAVELLDEDGNGTVTYKDWP